jgi:cytochrome P450
MEGVARDGAGLVVAESRQAPPAHWLLGHLPELRGDILAFLTRCEREYGPVVALRLYVVTFYLVNDPDLIQKILVTDNAKFVKPTGLRMVKPMFGEGLLTSDGEFWRTQRALIQPAFSRQNLERYASIIVQSAAEMLDSWEQEPGRDVHEDMTTVTLDIVARALFGTDIAAGREAITAATKGIQDFFTSWKRHYLLLPPWLPTPEMLRLKRSVREVDRTVFSVIAAREASADRGNDLLSALLDATREDGRRMSQKALRDELVTLFLAGHETSANALSWALYELAQHPGALSRLQAELQQVLGGRLPTTQDLPSLPYLEQVVKEVLRLYPSAHNIGRVAKEPCKLGDVTLAAGQDVLICVWAIQRSAKYYENPDAFIPERWEGARAKSVPKYAYFPFSAGPRNCVGAQFALLEIKLILATLLQRCTPEVEPGADIGIEAAITLRPARGMPMRIRRAVPQSQP